MTYINIKRLLPVWVAVFLVSIASAQTEEAEAIKKIEAHRKEQENEFRDPQKSPLAKKGLKKFKGLNYFPIDLEYRVKGTFVKNETPVLFPMKTTTSRLPSYFKYGEIHFSLKGHDYKLEVYQNPEIIKRPGYEDYLFIPFTDETNGKDTYGVGRYIDFRISTSNEVIIDFNVCYNPYCSYSPTYSCPIPPAVNHLPLEIRAGEKVYKANQSH